jgi:protoporphyrinogen/coproporphyrinogen III oxidase
MAAERETRDLVVCGGGISGLALAFLALRRGVHDVTVLEAAERPGGKIQSEWAEGLCCEWGPQGFLDNVPEMLALVDQLGLAGELVRADAAAADRFIVRGGRIRRLPRSPQGFLTSDVLSLPGRLRVLLEPFQPRGAGDESVYDFARRRIGREAAEVLVDAMVTGIFAGDSRQLSLPAAFPKMGAMEHAYGSLTRAMLARGKNGSNGGPMGPGGRLTTLRRGMQQLTDTLAASLGSRLRLRSAAGAIVREGSGFVVRIAGGEEIAARQVAVALPPLEAARVTSGVLPPRAVDALAAIPTAGVAVVMTGYRAARPFRRATEGFGFLVPGRERGEILGTIFCDSTFPSQAPPGTTLLRTLLGGARDANMLALSDDQMLAAVRRALDRYLGGDPAPDFVRIIRHERGIPQYTVGHLARLAEIEAAAAAVPGLHILGNGLHGIAANTCVVEAAKVAGRIGAER